MPKSIKRIFIAKREGTLFGCYNMTILDSDLVDEAPMRRGFHEE
jgi:hypothetical protein